MKILQKQTVLFLLILSFIGCSEKDNLITPAEKNVVLSPPGYTITSACVQFMGQYHNDILDYALAEMQNSSITLSTIKEEYDSLMINYGLEFLKSDTLFANNYDSLMYLNSNELLNTFRYNLNPNNNLQQPLEYTIVFNKIDSIINVSQTPTSCLFNLSLLDGWIELNINNEVDRVLLWMANSVAKKSVEYWSSIKIDDWELYLNQFGSQEKIDTRKLQGTVNWKSVASADVGALCVAAAGMRGQIAGKSTLFAANIIVCTLATGNIVTGVGIALVRTYGPEMATLAAVTATASAYSLASQLWGW